MDEKREKLKTDLEKIINEYVGNEIKNGNTGYGEKVRLSLYETVDKYSY